MKVTFYRGGHKSDVHRDNFMRSRPSKGRVCSGGLRGQHTYMGYDLFDECHLMKSFGDVHIWGLPSRGYCEAPHLKAGKRHVLYAGSERRIRSRGLFGRADTNSYWDTFGGQEVGRMRPVWITEGGQVLQGRGSRAVCLEEH